MNQRQQRSFVESLYLSPRWKLRVQNMEDDQITAIYLRVMRDGPPDPVDLIQRPDPISEQQLKLF